MLEGIKIPYFHSLKSLELKGEEERRMEEFDVKKYLLSVLGVTKME